MLALAGALAVEEGGGDRLGGVRAVTLSGMMVRIIIGRPVSRSVWMSASPLRAWMTGS